MTEMRRLDPDKDGHLVREALSWIDGSPRWFQDADAAWGADSPETYLNQMRQDGQADFGIFDPELIAVITITLAGKGIFNSHLMVKRHSSIEPIIVAAASLMKQLFESGMKEVWSWIMKRNHGPQRIVEAIGMKLDGVTMLKGESHGTVIEWVRYSAHG